MAEEEVDGGEAKPTGGAEPLPFSEINVNLTENDKFVAWKSDGLFAIAAKIQVDVAELETKLRTEFDEKIRVHHELAMTRIVSREKLCAEYGLRLDDQQRTKHQQAIQLDDLLNQVGILFFRFH